MVINLRKLLRLPVYTESGTKLGKIYDCEIDAETHAILRYIIKANFLSAANFLVQTSQVVAITTDRVVVEDMIIKSGAQAMFGGAALEE